MHHEWRDRVAGESGLLLIADAGAFQTWTGAVYDEAYELDPSCDYARAMAAVFPDDDEVDAAALDTGIVWQMEGAGVAEVATTGDGLLVMRSWTSRETGAPREFVTGARARAAERPAAEARVDSGRVVVVWAPVAAGETRRRDTRLDTVGMLNIGTVQPLPPGRYTAACGSHDGGDWDCRWIRLTRTGD